MPTFKGSRRLVSRRGKGSMPRLYRLSRTLECQSGLPLLDHRRSHRRRHASSGLWRTSGTGRRHSVGPVRTTNPNLGLPTRERRPMERLAMHISDERLASGAPTTPRYLPTCRTASLRAKKAPIPRPISPPISASRPSESVPSARVIIRNWPPFAVHVSPVKAKPYTRAERNARAE